MKNVLKFAYGIISFCYSLPFSQDSLKCILRKGVFDDAGGEATNSGNKACRTTP
jgi:hypothetical protein